MRESRRARDEREWLEQQAACDRQAVFVDALCALVPERDPLTRKITPASLAAVLKLVDGHELTNADFWTLDNEGIGIFGHREDDPGNGWHWKLRQLRNSPGHDLFGTLR